MKGEIRYEQQSPLDNGFVDCIHFQSGASTLPLIIPGAACFRLSTAAWCSACG